jgi:hypothetical protein
MQGSDKTWLHKLDENLASPNDLTRWASKLLVLVALLALVIFFRHLLVWAMSQVVHSRQWLSLLPFEQHWFSGLFFGCLGAVWLRAEIRRWNTGKFDSGGMLFHRAIMTTSAIGSIMFGVYQLFEAMVSR